MKQGKLPFESWKSFFLTPLSSLSLSLSLFKLSRHLGMQLETIESVYQDSYMAAGYMEDANAYLRKADKNFGDSSYWVFIFLVVASLVLLFLDWYGS